MPRTVLYVEDNLSTLRLVERILTASPGVKVIAAMQGRIGLDLAREHRPDVIVLDPHPPDISGMEVLERLRTDERTAQIPVVILSADATPGQIRRLGEAEAAAYLTKPLDVRRFLSVIADVVRQGHAER